MTDLVVVRNGEMELDRMQVESALLVPGGLDPLKIALRAAAEAEKAKLPTDLNKLVNRKKFRSLAAAIARTKRPLNDLCQQVLDGRKAEIDAQISDKKGEIDTLEAELKTIKANKKDAIIFMDTLRDEMKAPAEQWDKADKIRKENIEAEIAEIGILQEIEEDQSSEVFDDAIRRCEAFIIDERLQEYQELARQLQPAVLEQLRLKRQIAKTREDEEAREQKEHDEKIKREATRKAELEAEREKERARIREENLKKKNAAMIQKNIDGLTAVGSGLDDASAEQIHNKIATLNNIKIRSDHYGDRTEKAQEIHAKIKATLTELYIAKCRLDKEEESRQKRQKILDDEKAAADAVKAEESRKAREEGKRKADRKHVRRIDKEILEDVINLELGLGAAEAVKFRKFLKDGAIRNVSIQY